MRAKMRIGVMGTLTTVALALTVGMGFARRSEALGSGFYAGVLIDETYVVCACPFQWENCGCAIVERP